MSIHCRPVWLEIISFPQALSVYYIHWVLLRSIRVGYYYHYYYYYEGWPVSFAVQTWKLGICVLSPCVCMPLCVFVCVCVYIACEGMPYKGKFTL